MSQIELNFELGDNRPKKIRYLNQDKITPINLTGCSVYFIALSGNLEDEIYSTESNHIALDEPNGIIYLSLSDTEKNNINNRFCRLVITFPDASSMVLAKIKARVS
jgi:hypothetical protein